MKRVILVLSSLLFCLLCLTGCDNDNDHINIYNKQDWVFDDVNIDIKDGYFYDRHEKFTVDDNTVAVTIYFTISEDWGESDGWDD